MKKEIYILNMIEYIGQICYPSPQSPKPSCAKDTVKDTEKDVCFHDVIIRVNSTLLRDRISSKAIIEMVEKDRYKLTSSEREHFYFCVENKKIY